MPRSAEVRATAWILSAALAGAASGRLRADRSLPSSECTKSETKFLPPPASDGHEFGHSVGASGDVAVVGARFDGESGALAGAVYVYHYEADVIGWLPPVKLTPGGPGDQVGFSVAAGRDVVVAGARRDRDNGTDAGAAYLYRYDAQSESWGAPHKVAPGGTNDQVGFAVAASEDVVVLGAPFDDDSGTNAGAVYIYRYDRDAMTWGDPVKLAPASAGDAYGRAVALGGNVLVVGALLDDTAGQSAGAAYIYRYDPVSDEWVFSVKVAPGDAFDEFGHSVTASGDLVAVGARLDDEGGVDAGAIYVYRYAPGFDTWDGPIKFAPAAAGDDFGWSLAASGDILAVGAYTDAENGIDAGAVYTYTYDRETGTWGAPEKTSPASGGDQFGFSIAVSGAMTVVGARYDDERGSFAGAAYAYGCPRPLPPIGDLDGDGIVGFADLLILLGAWGPCPDCPSDLNNDGFVGFSDLLMLLSGWG